MPLAGRNALGHLRAFLRFSQGGARRLRQRQDAPWRHGRVSSARACGCLILELLCTSLTLPRSAKPGYDGHALKRRDIEEGQHARRVRRSR